WCGPWCPRRRRRCYPRPPRPSPSRRSAGPTPGTRSSGAHWTVTVWREHPRSVLGQSVEERLDGLVVGQVGDLLDPDPGQRLLDLGPALLLADQVGGTGDGLIQQGLIRALCILRGQGVALRGLLVLLGGRSTRGTLR